MPELSPTQKGTLAYRIIIAVMMFIGAFVGNRILGYAESSNKTLVQVDKDVTQIKWELPVIKSTIVADKVAVQKQVDLIHGTLDALRDKGDAKSDRISSLETELKLLKQKLDIR